MAYWMLWLACPQAELKSKKWQQYAYKNTQAYASNVASPSQVQQQMERIIWSGQAFLFDQKPFLPKLKLNGRGRQKGEERPKRAKHPVKRKTKKVKKAIINPKY